MTDSYTIITGGLGGLGSAFALECGLRHRHLILIDQHLQGSEIVDYIRDHFQVIVHYFTCDLADHEARGKFLKKLTDERWQINGLINVVGQEMEGKFLNRTREELQEMLQLNIGAMVDLSLAALMNRSENQRFLLINVASLAGYFPMPYKLVYAASKRFIINFSLGLRQEIREFGNVTVLCPGGLPTNAEAMKKIFMQGFWGKITAHDTSDVVRNTMNKAEKNIPVYIPGIPSKFLVWITRILPDHWVAAYLSGRWGKKQEHLDLWRISNGNKSQQRN